MTPAAFLARWALTDQTLVPDGWRARARRVIERVVVAGLEAGHVPERIHDDLDAAYPFGIRQYTPSRSEQAQQSPFQFGRLPESVASRKSALWGDVR